MQKSAHICRLTTLWQALLLTLAAVAGSLVSYAAPQPATTYFKVIDTSSGLPDNSVNDIAEDRYGFLWIATWNGLARFDGKNTVTYSHSDNETSLANNMVRCILPAENGIWAGSDGGLDFLRYADSRFIPSFCYTSDGRTELMSKRVSHITSKNGLIFALTVDGDLLRLEKGYDNEQQYNQFRRLGRPVSRVYADISPYSGNRLIALSNEGVTVLSGDGERELRHYPHRMAFDSNMNLFCDTLSNILYIGAGIGSRSIALRIDEETASLVPAQKAPVATGLMRTTSAGGNIYMATDGNGLYITDSDGNTTNYTPKNSSLPGDAIYSVFADSNNNLWCGTYRHGLCLLSHDLNAYTIRNATTGSLSYDIVTAIVPDKDRMYVGLDGGGIDIYDFSTGKSQNFNSVNSKLPGNNVVSLVKDDNTLWAAVYSCGLVSFDLDKGDIQTYKVNTGYETGNKLWVIAEDNTGTLWVGGRALHTFNKTTKKFTLVEGCDNVMAMSIVMDDKNIWVGTRFKGILQIDRQTRRVTERFSNSPTTSGAMLPGHQVEFMAMDSLGIIWADLGSKGLCSIDTRNDNEVKSYALNKVLAKERVRSMVNDDNNDLWFGTDAGLYKYIRSTGTIIRKTDSRLPLSYTSNATARLGDTVYFGTTGGLLSFSLAETSSAFNFPPTLFTSLEIFDSQGTSMPLYSIGDTTVVLANSQNFFKVSFSVPEMSNPDRLNFECRLDGLEDVWRDVSDARSATYTNVPPGNYRLLVRHTNIDGNWCEPVSLGIKVNHAWYASMWISILWFLLVVLLIAFALYFWRKYIINQEKAMMAELERDSQKRLNEAKLDFYANITHELRTPCFLISAQIEEIFDSERQTIPVSALSGVYRNSAKLNKLINHIIDFRKNESGKLKLSSRKTELTKFLRDLTIDYEQLCRQKSITFSYEHDEPPIIAYIDPDKVEQIVTNLVSNAYKYTPRGGSVRLSVKDQVSNIAIIVSDTGIGIVDKLHSVIFQPFERTERGRSQSSGDGIGLAFVKELVELHGGRIELESRVNEGSTFTVVLPKKRLKLAPEREPSTTNDAPDTSETILPPPPAPIAAQAASPAGTLTRSSELIVNPTATRSILLVDDDPEVTALISGAFADEYRVSRAGNGAEGLEMVKSGRFDIVITDIMMPEADGHFLVQSIKSDPHLRSVKVVVFTAMVEEEAMLKALDEGADAFLTKPTSLKVLRRQVDRLFEVPEGLGSISVPTPNGTFTREEQKFLIRCREIIDEHLLDEAFTIELLATKLAMSHSTLYKRIRKMTGLTLIEFISEYRVCKAVAYFNRGNTNVQKVGEMCGFRDSKTFREAFKRKMNMPPKQFISQLNRTGNETAAQPPQPDSSAADNKNEEPDS